jgi:hypothetical protein
VTLSGTVPRERSDLARVKRVGCTEGEWVGVVRGRRVGVKREIVRFTETGVIGRTECQGSGRGRVPALVFFLGVFGVGGMFSSFSEVMVRRVALVSNTASGCQQVPTEKIPEEAFRFGIVLPQIPLKSFSCWRCGLDETQTVVVGVCV